MDRACGFGPQGWGFDSLQARIFHGPVAQPRLNRGQLVEMCWFYILKNKKTGKYYSGSTNNIKRRVKQHKSGYTRTTRILQTDELVYAEKFNTIQEARMREKKIKSYKSKKYIEWLISNQGL